MAILGGAGNPVGGSFTGPAEALDIYGDFAAAYSGQVQINTTEVEHLNFTSGNYLFVGELTLTGPIKLLDPAGGASAAANIEFNDVGLIKVKADTALQDMPSQTVIPIIIPAYTKVMVEVKSNQTSAGYTTSVNLIGRIYRD